MRSRVYCAVTPQMVGKIISGVLLRPLVILAALFWPLLLAAAIPQQEIESAGRACPVDRLAAVLNRAAPAPRTLLAYADYGSELLYRTPHRVLSIPNHRPQPGFAATYRILTATDEAPARAELTRFGVDWILLCPSATERALFAVPGEARPTLYQRLADGDVPPWLRPLPLQGDLAAAARDARLRAQGGAERHQELATPRTHRAAVADSVHRQRDGRAAATSGALR